MSEKFVDGAYRKVERPEEFGVYWICMCAPDECDMHPIGPFLYEEDARREANVGCSNAHFVVPRRGTYRQVNEEAEALRLSNQEKWNDRYDDPKKYANASLENLL